MDRKKYSDHLDWHYKVNTRERSSTRRTYRGWFMLAEVGRPFYCACMYTHTYPGVPHTLAKIAIICYCILHFGYYSLDRVSNIHTTCF